MNEELLRRCRKGRPCEIVVFMHGSATEQGIKLYQLTGRDYRRIAEYDAVRPEDENGRIAPKAIVTRVR